MKTLAGILLVALAVPVMAAVEGTVARQRRTLTTRLAAFVAVLLTRDPVSRATIQFVMSTVGRVGMHRLVLAMAVGVALAFVMPIVGSSLGTMPRRPTMSLLALPVVPAMLRQWRESASTGLRLVAHATIPLAFAGVVAAWGVLALATLPGREAWLPFGRPVPGFAVPSSGRVALASSQPIEEE